MSARDRRLAEEMRRKHGASYESASARSARKASEPTPTSTVSGRDLANAAAWVAKTPESAKRRSSYRASLEREARSKPASEPVRSITAWFRSGR